MEPVEVWRCGDRPRRLTQMVVQQVLRIHLSAAARHIMSIVERRKVSQSV